MASIAGGVRRSVESWRDRGKGQLRSWRERWAWFDHLAAAYERYSERQGNQLAAAVSYFGFLSVFPLAALAFALVGYAVGIDPDARDYVVRGLDETLPGLADELPVDQIAKAKAGAGLIGLVGLLYVGVGWIGALRCALRAIWLDDPGGGGNVVVKKAGDGGVLVFLGLALLFSVVVASMTTSATHHVLHFLGASDQTGAGTAVRILSIAVVATADTLIFLVLFKRLSGTRAHWRDLLQGALVGAAGLGVLKLATGLLIKHITTNPVYASFAVLVGLLVWINLVSRFMLYTAAWTATRPRVLRADKQAQ